MENRSRLRELIAEGPPESKRFAENSKQFFDLCSGDTTNFSGNKFSTLYDFLSLETILNYQKLFFTEIVSPEYIEFLEKTVSDISQASVNSES